MRRRCLNFAYKRKRAGPFLQGHGNISLSRHSARHHFGSGILGRDRMFHEQAERCWFAPDPRMVIHSFCLWLAGARCLGRKMA